MLVCDNFQLVEQRKLEFEEDFVMNDFWLLVLIVVLLLGGGCSLAGTFWSRKYWQDRKNKKNETDKDKQ